MKNNILVFCVLSTLIFSSCKNETPKKDEVVPSNNMEKTIKLSNYSDTNWKSGVAIELNMFLVDNTIQNLELVKNAKKFHFADGTFANITGFKEADKFIQVFTLEKASNFMNQAVYPFEIIIE